MKKIIAYVNTLRVHWVVEELGKVGIREMLVVEYFRPLSRISRFEFFCREDQVSDVSRIIHRIGTMGIPGDHVIEIQDVEPGAGELLFAGSLSPNIEKGG